MIVVDASVLAPALGDDTSDGDLARDRLRGKALVAPELVDLEVVSVWRRKVRTRELEPRRAEFALADLRTLQLERVSHRRLLDRCWHLRDNLTISDASYVALAEALDAVLVTGDGKLANAPACGVGSTSSAEPRFPFAPDQNEQAPLRRDRGAEPEECGVRSVAVGRSANCPLVSLVCARTRRFRATRGRIRPIAARRSRHNCSQRETDLSREGSSFAGRT